MSQKKVDAYKQNKKNRANESRNAVRRRRLEIGIVLVVIAVGLVWFIVAGVSNSSGKQKNVSINTEAIDNYGNELQTVLIAGDGETDAEPAVDAADAGN
ncbi:MAG: hypothetical protein IKG70_00285 [Lachnospiraceae bacterium]|nr:hypothetical protein [Lachnospiraceae bacterium]